MIVRNALFALGVCFCAWSATAAVDVADDEFHFVVLGDSQFDDPPVFNRSIDQIRLLRPAFVVQVGDLINGYVNDLEEIEDEWDRFGGQIAPLAPISFFAVPGNHDVYNGDGRVDPAIEALYEARWGDLYYRFTYKNAEFIVLNSDSSRRANAIDREQMAWLDSALDAEDVEHTFVFLHKPPFSLANGEALHRLFVRRGVDWVIYGHHHHHHQHYALRDGVRYVMTNNSGANPVPHDELGAFKHWLFVTVRDAEASVASIEVDSVRPVDYVTIEDNYGYFRLQRDMPWDVVALGDGERFSFDLAIPNPTTQALTAFVSCSSPDGRWRFEPTAVPAMPIDAGSSVTVPIEVLTDRNPLGRPECLVEMPYQTSSGRWLRFERDVRIELRER